ncbi:hypothetical protein AB0J63_26835 [Streptosporangium canum]|uniref:hypothetical protein n=1 Tax=Streptosporangium canum TaxID=324952 RepID=UPI0034422231
MMASARWLSVNDAARLLGVPVQDVIRLASTKAITCRPHYDHYEIAAAGLDARLGRPAPAAAFLEPSGWDGEA